MFIEGPGAGEPVNGTDGTVYGSGGSHGGDGGADNEFNDAPPAYGSFVAPTMFGSPGGDADTSYPG